MPLAMMLRPFANNLNRLDSLYRERPYFAGVRARLLAGFILLVFAVVALNVVTLLSLQSVHYLTRITGNLTMALAALVSLRLLFRGRLALAGNVLAIALIVPANAAALLPLWRVEPVSVAIKLFAYNVGFLLMTLVFASRRVAFALLAFIVVSQAAHYYTARSGSLTIPGSLDFASSTLLHDGLQAICVIFFLGTTVIRMIESAHHRSEESLRQTRALNENLEHLVADRTGELVRLNGQLVQLNEDKNAFMGMAAHDLRNPAVQIRMIAETLELEGDYSEPRVRAELATIAETATRQLGLLNDLLDVTAIEEGKVALRPVVLDACAILRAIHADFLRRASAKGLELVLVEPPAGAAGGLPALIDDAAIRQVLENLVSNAVKYSPAGKRVWLSVAPAPGHRVRFAVRDEGPGISEADRARLFTKFSRLSAQPTGGESSTGLGLSIVKRLVEGMAGMIGVDSAPGAGATFYVEFPAA